MLIIQSVNKSLYRGLLLPQLILFCRRARFQYIKMWLKILCRWGVAGWFREEFISPGGSSPTRSRALADRVCLPKGWTRPLSKGGQHRVGGLSPPGVPRALRASRHYLCGVTQRCWDLWGDSKPSRVLFSDVRSAPRLRPRREVSARCTDRAEKRIPAIPLSLGRHFWSCPCACESGE